MSYDQERVASILVAAASGDRQAEEELWPVIYEDLKELAHARLARRGPGDTLQTTELVHESWMRLIGGDQANWSDRRYFFGAAARAMHNVLIDRARKRGAVKRPAGVGPLLDEEVLMPKEGIALDDVLSLSEAIEALSQEHERPARIVALRFYTGLSMQETADAADVSLATAERDWRFARAWLESFLTDGGQE